MNSDSSNIITFPEIAKQTGFEIASCDLNTIVPGAYMNLNVSKIQKSQIGLLQSQLPTIAETEIMANAYIVKFPEGLPHTMMQLKQGGVSTTLVNDNHKIAGTASLFEIGPAAAIASCFSVMSFATGQYYLQNLHNDLNMMNQKIDKILGFLYGEKSAELLAEISFVNDAYSNYDMIIQHEIQKLATLTNLQVSKKIAMKDIEFYINDLENTVQTSTKNYQEFESVVTDALKIKDSLELATQLYAMSTVLEVYYSENFDQKYIDFVKDSIDSYITKCDNRILAEFSRLNGRNSEFKSNLLKKLDTSSLENTLTSVTSSYASIKDSKDRKSIVSILDSINKPVEYLITSDGSVAFKESVG